MLLVFSIMVGLFGLLIGSFLNVVAIRTLKQESIAYPPSHCVHCNHRLGVLDLIPVISYLGLKGKCRYCSERISVLYPLGEALAALIYGVLAFHFEVQAELIVALVFASNLVIIIVTDLKERIIPNKVLLLGIIVLALLRIFIHSLPLYNYVIAFFVGGGVILLISILGSLVLRKESMGGGDIKLFALIGLVVGIKLIFLSIFLASLLGTLYGVYLMLIRRYNRDQYIPFAPFIAAGSIMAYMWGDTVITWYLKLLL
jgi:leader peptidase (prepilin peptidase)/N-methyltransferase